MTDDPRLDELLARWRERAGAPGAVDAVCAGCPELAEPLRRRIADLAWMEGFLGETPALQGPTPTPEAFAEETLGPVAPRAAGAAGWLGPYRILRELGAGGMGVVWLAEDPTLGRRVAIKVMKPEIADRADARERFLREARAAAQVSHEHVVAIHHVGEEGGAPYLVMPLLEGESLDARLRRQGRLPMAEVLRIGREAAEGLAAAHAKGLVHRDVKPANLWLETLPGEPGRVSAGSFRVKVLDFGLARLGDAAALTQSGSLMGTPAYVAPEQVRGRPVDARTDLFSLGVVLYELAAGRRPFQGADTLSLLGALANDEPPPVRSLRADVPLALADLIARMLAKDPERRPASAREVAQTLRSLEARSAPEDETAPLPTSPPRRRWRWVAAGLVAALLLAGGGVWYFSRPTPVLDPAPASVAPAPAEVSWKGDLDVVVWSKTDENRRRLGLRDLGALPLRRGDTFRILADVEPAAFVYLFWIDTEGGAVPLYPWSPGRWGTRDAMEQPTRRVRLPEGADDGWEVPAGRESGMYTLLMLARKERWALGDSAVQKLFAGLPPQRPWQHERAAVWFENGEVAAGDTRRAPAFFSVKKIDDPMLRLQRLLKERLQPHAALTRAVGFARQGD